MTKKTKKTNSPLRVGIVVPHIFMNRDLLENVIFSPAQLALALASGLQAQNIDVTLFSPGPVDTPTNNITADLSYFEEELKRRDDTYIELLKKHPFTFITLARQVQAELIAKAYDMANNNKLDIVHIYTNEEETALPFAKLCRKPVVFTHHDPFNFLVKYKNLFPKYKDLNWLSMSYAQREGMPVKTNWVGNIYHGVDINAYHPAANPSGGYLLYMGRVIQPKGVHLAIQATRHYNKTHNTNLVLKIAGKHYSGHSKDTYWQDNVAPHIKDNDVEYLGFVGDTSAKQLLMANAEVLIVPSLFEEPFGMVIIEALASGTPVIGLDSGAIPEIISNKKEGFIVHKVHQKDGKVDEEKTIIALAQAIAQRHSLDRTACRQTAVERFSELRMCQEHADIYQQLKESQDQS